MPAEGGVSEVETRGVFLRRKPALKMLKSTASGGFEVPRGGMAAWRLKDVSKSHGVVLRVYGRARAAVRTRFFRKGQR